ncbi:hypothetical protein [Mucilaginibacter pineti]|nr:hypothetical protein [Mucilaginibacter pineti]
MKTHNLLNASAIVIVLAVTCACNSTDTHTKSVTSRNLDKTPGAGSDKLAGTLKQYPEVHTWIDDFRNFRNAANDKDTPKLKNYFNFPLNADSTQIWYAIFDTEAELEKVRNGPELFSEKDFERYSSKLFRPAFVRSLLKIKSAKLFDKGESESPKFNDKDGYYYMIVTFNKESQTLSLNIAYLNGNDENGDYVSEGEHNIIYDFDIIDHKYLRFKRIMIAG